jgi:hypothetical protein
MPLVADMSFRLLVSECYILAELQLQAVQFHLFTTTILFISREGFRRGCLRGHVGYASLFQILLQSSKHLCHVESQWSLFWDLRFRFLIGSDFEEGDGKFDWTSIGVSVFG